MKKSSELVDFLISAAVGAGGWGLATACGNPDLPSYLLGMAALILTLAINFHRS